MIFELLKRPNRFQSFNFQQAYHTKALLHLVTNSCKNSKLPTMLIAIIFNPRTYRQLIPPHMQPAFIQSDSPSQENNFILQNKRFSNSRPDSSRTAGIPESVLDPFRKPDRRHQY